MFGKIKKYFSYFKEVDTSSRPIPCVSCGACCAYFKVEFSRENNPQVPWQKIIIQKDKKAFMKGAEKFKGRCDSLLGNLGENCSCSIYENRPDVCAAFPVWLNNGKQNPKCIKAREHNGLKGKIEY